MRTAEGDIARLIHVSPSPAAVARIAESHGVDAAAARYYWLSERTIATLVRRGNVEAGKHVALLNARKSAIPPDVLLAAIECGFVLGSGSAGEAAAGISKSSLQRAFEARGLPWPRAPSESRSRNSTLGRRAADGDAEARAAIDARLAHDRDVYRVCHAALVLVPDQPAVGRPRMPEPSPELAAVLAGHSPAAVAAVFPDLEIPRCA